MAHADNGNELLDIMYVYRREGYEAFILEHEGTTKLVTIASQAQRNANVPGLFYVAASDVPSPSKRLAMQQSPAHYLPTEEDGENNGLRQTHLQDWLSADSWTGSKLNAKGWEEIRFLTAARMASKDHLNSRIDRGLVVIPRGAKDRCSAAGKMKTVSSTSLRM